MAYDGSIRINTKINTAGFKQGASTIGAQAKNLSARVGNVGRSITGLIAKIGVLAGVTGMIVFGKQCIQAASDLQEVQNVVDVAFGSMSQKAEDFASTALEQFGLSEYSAKKMSSTYMAMGKSMGLSMEQASDMAISMSKRTADISSFYNLTAEEAAIKLKSIYTGETETLKDLGIVMTQANLKQFALSQGITKSYDAMSQGEQVALRYKFVMQASNDAAGDFVRTSGSWANQTRVLSERFTQLKTILGSYLITALTPIIQGLNTILGRLIDIATAAKDVLGSIFGIEFQDMASSATTVESGLDGVSDGLDNVADSAEKAAKKQEKVNNALASFDKLNKLSAKDSKSSSTSNTTSSPGAIDSILGDISSNDSPIKKAGTSVDNLTKSVEKLLKQIKKASKSGDFTSLGKTIGTGISNALLGINWNAMNDTADKIGKSIATFLNGVIIGTDWSLVGKTFANSFNTVLTGLESFIRSFNWKNAGKALTTTLHSFMQNLNFATVGKAVSSAVKGTLDFATGLINGINWRELPSLLLSKLKELVTNIDYKDVATSLGELIGSALKAGIDLITGLQDISKALIDKIVTAISEYTNEAGGNVLAGILAGIADGISNIQEWCYTNIVKPFLHGVISGFAGEAAADKFDKIADNLFNGIKSAWQRIKNTVLDVGFAMAPQNAANNLLNVLRTAWKQLTERVLFIGFAILNPDTIAKNLFSTLQNLWSVITKILFVSISLQNNIAKDMWEDLKAKWNAMSNILYIGIAIRDSALKALKEGLPGLIKFAISGGEDKATGGVYNSGMWRDIPQFATGMPYGVRGTLFRAGEAGPEIVAQGRGGSSEILNKSQIASAVYSAMMAAQANNNGGQSIDVNVIADPDKMFKVMVKKNKRNTLMTNKNAFAL